MEARKDSLNFKDFKKFKRVKNHALSEMNFTNAIWFAVASLLQQGGETYPKSPSARLTTVAWWLATVILVATYTANLAAWLTKSRTNTAINSVEDLGSQNKLPYGTIPSSSVWQFFLDSDVTLFKQMKEAILSKNSFVNGTTEGVKKTRAGSFAFLWDSPVLDYIVQQEPCDTIQTVGRLFGRVGYGLGLQKNSRYNEELSMHILQLRETGYMDELKQKWFHEKTECAGAGGDQSEQEQQIEAAGGQLDITNVLGVFYIIYGGLSLSFLVLLMEWIAKCLSSVDWMGVDPLVKPRTFSEAVRRRWKKMVNDFKEEWSRGCCTESIPYEKQAGDARGLTDIQTIALSLQETKTTDTKEEIKLRHSSTTSSGANLLENMAISSSPDQSESPVTNRKPIRNSTTCETLTSLVEMNIVTDRNHQQAKGKTTLDKIWIDAPAEEIKEEPSQSNVYVYTGKMSSPQTDGKETGDMPALKIKNGFKMTISLPHLDNQDSMDSGNSDIELQNAFPAVDSDVFDQHQENDSQSRSNFIEKVRAQTGHNLTNVDNGEVPETSSISCIQRDDRANHNMPGIAEEEDDFTERLSIDTKDPYITDSLSDNNKHDGGDKHNTSRPFTAKFPCSPKPIHMPKQPESPLHSHPDTQPTNSFYQDDSVYQTFWKL